MNMNVPLPYQQVKCKDCGREYRCAPWDDYYNNTTNDDGVCERCLLRAYPEIKRYMTYDEMGRLIEEGPVIGPE